LPVFQKNAVRPFRAYLNSVTTRVSLAGQSLLRRLLALLPQAKSSEAAIVDNRSTGVGPVNGTEPDFAGLY